MRVLRLFNFAAVAPVVLYLGVDGEYLKQPFLESC